MSDSDDLSTPTNFPPDAEIEACLRRIVREALKAGEEVAVNGVRTRAETDLGLEAGFFKTDAAWKVRSREVVQAEFEDPKSPEKVDKSAPKSTTGGKKRLSDAISAERNVKRRREILRQNSNDDDDKAEINGGNAAYLANDTGSNPPPGVQRQAGQSTTDKTVPEDDDSDLSSVIDEPAAPVKKKRQRQSASKPSKSDDKAKKGTVSSKTTSNDEDEIKRLQGWLLKCGIRKIWSKELKQYDTSKEKIKHLKDMLEEVGMTGRYSAERAKSIKEARELAAELESAKEFNQKWGQKDSDEEDDKGDEQAKTLAPRRRPKGLIDFGDSGDSGDDGNG